MKRSAINQALAEARRVFLAGGWVLPPEPRWDVTDFGQGDFPRCGIVLINLTEEPEYSEKLIYMRRRQTLPLHTHRLKKEDIICRRGAVTLELWAGHPDQTAPGTPLTLKRNGASFVAASGQAFTLAAGERVTLVPGVFHRFWPTEDDTIIGEVSTANNDVSDNIFTHANTVRFTEVEEDEPATVKLVSDR